MGDTVLTDNDNSIGQPRRNVMAEVGVDGRNDTNDVVFNATNAAEKVDCTFEAAAKEPGTGEEEVANGSRSEIKG